MRSETAERHPFLVQPGKKVTRYSFNYAEMSDISAGIMIEFPLFSYTFQLRSG